MVIPYRTSKFNIFAMAILGPTAKFNTNILESVNTVLFSHANRTICKPCYKSNCNYLYII